MSVCEIDRRNIIMCGDRFGTLHIYIQNTIDEKAKKNIMEKIDANFKATKHKYVTHLTSGKIKKLHVTCGMQIRVNSQHGTLGGFAYRENDQSLYALLSKNVAMHLTEFRLGPVLANVITPHTEKIDIATAEINAEDKCHIDTSFRDIRNRPRNCTLFTYANDNVSHTLEKFEMVFIRGGTTRVGQGEIVCISVEKNGFPLLRIKNRADTPYKDFCKPGDSGAIVCSTTRDGFMYALAMVVGENFPQNDQKEYIACMLMDGLDELSRTHACTYRLCEGSNET